MNRFLKIISEKGTLSEAEAELAMEQILNGSATPEEIAGFLMGLRGRGETVDELVGFTRVMRRFAVPVLCPDANAIDMCGTGGDHANTFNISTTAAFVCAGAGVTVAKHGNRSVSSLSGSADVLEALGVKTEIRAKGVEYCLDKAGIAFMFAPYFHPAMKFVMPVRRALGVRTFFNILGPMCNPAGVNRQLIGAFSLPVAETMAQILHRLGADRVVTVHADDGLDELSTISHTDLFVVDGDQPRKAVFNPGDCGIPQASEEDILGGDATFNAQILESVLTGDNGPQSDIVVVNAAYALWVSGKFNTIDDSLAAARESIRSGSAMSKLEALRKVSHEAPSS